MAGVTFDGVSKVYPDGTRAVNDIDLDDRGRRVHGARRAVGLRQDDRAAHGRGARGDLRAARCGSASASSTTCPRATATSRWSSRATRSTRTCRVYENIAFGLRAEEGAEGRDRRARAGRPRGRSASSRFLKRKPRALSGGQRQRVAMGRAIVRQPQAFLMDEPLSNLDAKLRVQMRAEIARLQHDLGVTTIYVTHDQVEAMTMGDRVAVMRKGELQQVADAADALRPAGQPLRRRLHRLAGDEHGRGHGRARRTAASPSTIGGADARARRRAGRDPARRSAPTTASTVDPRDPARGPRGRRARARHAGRPAAHGQRSSCARRSAPS